jgi:hypothetical protein
VHEKSYLVVYDYGMGGVWAIVYADSADSITTRYPELTIVDSRPAWMTHEQFARLAQHDIDAEPAGLLQDLIAGRGR